jgi:hypothetical protein
MGAQLLDRGQRQHPPVPWTIHVCTKLSMNDEWNREEIDLAPLMAAVAPPHPMKFDYPRKGRSSMNPVERKPAVPRAKDELPGLGAGNPHWSTPWGSGAAVYVRNHAKGMRTMLYVSQVANERLVGAEGQY